MLVNLKKLEDRKLAGFDGFYKPNLEFNGNLDLWGWCGSSNFDRGCFEVGNFNSYGVCDSPEQFAQDCKAIIQNDPRPMVVFFSHVAKNPLNVGRGGGWRWHKWGPYIGRLQPTTEYLDDEEGFADGIYCYHLYLVDTLNYEVPKSESTEREFLIYWLLRSYHTMLRAGWEDGPTHEECSKELLNVLCNLGYRPDVEPALTLAKRKPKFIPPQE